MQNKKIITKLTACTLIAASLVTSVSPVYAKKRKRLPTAGVTKAVNDLMDDVNKDKARAAEAAGKAGADIAQKQNGASSRKNLYDRDKIKAATDAINSVQNTEHVNTAVADPEQEQVDKQARTNARINPDNTAYAIETNGSGETTEVAIKTNQKIASESSSQKYNTIAYALTDQNGNVVCYIPVSGGPVQSSDIKRGGRVERTRVITEEAIAAAILAQDPSIGSTAAAREKAHQLLNTSGVKFDSVVAIHNGDDMVNYGLSGEKSGITYNEKTGEFYYKGKSFAEIMTGNGKYKKELAAILANSYDLSNIKDRKRLPGWISRDIKTMIDKYVRGNPGPPDEPTPDDAGGPPNIPTINIDSYGLMASYNTWDETAETSNGGNDGAHRSSSAPYYTTYNDSREYNDSEGHHDPFTEEDSKGIVIPSGEKYINGYQSDAYWGTVGFSLAESIHTYKAQYEYDWTVLRYDDYKFTYSTTDTNGNVEEKHTGGYTEDGERTDYIAPGQTRVAYNYVIDSGDFDLQDFANSITHNDTFSNDSLSYNKTEAHSLNNIAPNNHGPVDGGVSTTTETPTYIFDSGMSTGTYGNGITWLDLGPSDSEKVLGNIGKEGGFTVNPSGVAYAKANENLDYHVGNGKDKKSIDANGNVYDSYAQYTTGKFIISYGGNQKVFMPGSSGWVNFNGSNYDCYSIFSEGQASAIPYLSQYYPKNMFLSANGGGVDVNTFETSPAFGKAQTQIPSNQSNGTYPTTVNAKYTPAQTQDGILLSAKGDTSFTSGNIKASYRMNEPVTVHTPVISPVDIFRDNGQDISNTSPKQSSAENDALFSGEVNKVVPTQLVTGKADKTLPQMRLDETYWFKFSTRQHLKHMGYLDANTHSNAWDNLGETDSKYDKYVKAKYVHFPVDVILYIKNTPTYIKHVSDENEPGYWTVLEQSDWENVKFYIPVWAKEGVHNSGEDQILYKVESKNVISQDNSGQGAGDHSKDKNARKKELNDHGNGDSTPDKELYVATYEIPIQISGWIYDFQIVGLNDSKTYNTDSDDDSYANSWYALASDGKEKKTGTYNRLGGDTRYTNIWSYVRQTKDGKVINPWDTKNTITVGSGSSDKYDKMGEQRKGTRFAFSVRTISNLWNDNDSITITPTFRYIDDNGKSSKNVYVYYHDESGEYKQLYVPYGSTADKALVNKVSLGDKGFTDSYYDSDLKQTASVPKATYNSTGDVTGFTNTKSGSTSDKNALLQKKVDSYTLSNITLSSSLRLLSGDSEQLRDNLSKDTPTAVTDMFKASAADQNRISSIFENTMQTWYGEYYVPSALFISYKSPAEIKSYATSHEGGLSENDKNVWLQGGYVVVNFDITTNKNGTPDLNYGAKNDGYNMWTAQKQKTSVEVPDHKNPEKTKTITTNPGDVIVIDMNKSTKDESQAQIFVID